MDEPFLHAIQKSYDAVADEYARYIFAELDNKPLDRELLRRLPEPRWSHCTTVK